MTHMKSLILGVLVSTMLAGVGAASAAPAAHKISGLVGCGFDGDCLKKCSQDFLVLYPICIIGGLPPQPEE